MTHERWSYPPELMDALSTFGLKPSANTPPSLVREALNDLYRFEIRRLRQRLLNGQVEKERYADEVIALRKTYWPLSLQPAQWEKIAAEPRSDSPNPKS